MSHGVCSSLQCCVHYLLQMVCSALANESLRIIADLEHVNSTLVQAMLNETVHCPCQ